MVPEDVLDPAVEADVAELFHQQTEYERRLSTGRLNAMPEALRLISQLHNGNALSPDEVVASLQAFIGNAAAASACCRRLGELAVAADTNPVALAPPVADTGALEAVVAAMLAHRQVQAVQEEGCWALSKLTGGIDGMSCLWRAADAGAIEAIVAAMEAHEDVGVQGGGCQALDNLALGIESEDLERKQRAVEAGAIEAVVAAMRFLPHEAGVQGGGASVLFKLTVGPDAAVSVRRQRAVDAGAVDVVIGSLQAPGCCNGVVAAILQNLKGLSPTPERTEKRVTFGKAPATQLPRLGSFPRWSGGWGGWDSARFSSSAPSRDSSAAEVTAGLSRSSSSEVCADLP